jgi:DNA-binding CsgD family transcriptional regulator
MAALENLLERESELAELELALKRALEGEGSCVLIEGTAGIGKTSLLRALRDQAAVGALTVLRARGTELEQTLPYGIVRQLFERAVVRASPEERADALAGAAEHAAPVLEGGLAAPAAAADGDSAFAVLHGLYWLAANLAERGPLVIAIDDLHWADAASVSWLAYLAHRIDGLPLLAVSTVRPVRGEAAPALADLLADPATLIIRPNPLTPDAAAVIIGEQVEADAFEGVRDAAHGATAGNPLLLRELAGALAASDESGDLVAAVERLAPDVVARRVRLELAKLGADATELARAVAVIGDDAVCSSCIPAQAGLDDERADRVAELLARAEVLRHDRPLRFVHPLMRQAVYESLSPSERGSAHRRAAVLLGEMGAPIDRVAAQLVLAPPALDPSAVESLRAAARTSLAAGAADSALTYLRRALAEPPPSEVRADVLIELASAGGLAGSAETVVHLREALSLLEDQDRRIEVRRQLARGLFWRSQEEEAVAEINAALAEIPSADSPLRRTLEADYFSAALRMPELHADALDRLAQMEPADSEDSGALMLLALKSYGAMVRGEGREEAVSLAERALARGVPTEEAPSWSLWGAVSSLLQADHYEAAASVVDQALAEARRRGAVYMFSGASMVRASIRLAAGELMDAEADARASVEALPNRVAMLMPLSFGVLAEVLVERGSLEDAAAVLAEAGADGELPESFTFIPLINSRAMLRLAQGDPGAAALDAAAAGRAFKSVGFRNPGAARWRSLKALALMAGGETPEARQLASEELELSRRWGTPRAIGRSLRVLGLSKGGKAGLSLLEESVTVLRESPALLERARAHVEFGAALRRSGKRVEARDELRVGAELAQRCGAAGLAAKAHEELLAAGAKPRSTALSGVESLTPSERRVAGMAAEGMGNREIAQALFVTLRTVEMHLSNAFRKLDVSSRTQLVGALAESSDPGRG